MQNVIAKHEMYEEIGGGETSKQGQEVESVSCQANNVGQFRQTIRLLGHPDTVMSYNNIICGTVSIVSLSQLMGLKILQN